MTLTSTTTKLQYNGDGSTVSFPITFIYWLNADIKVIHKDAAGVETTWTLGTQYTLTGGEGSTGTLTVEVSPTDYTPASGETLTIKSIVPNTQTTTLPLGGALPSSSIEERLDKNVRLIQQSGEELDRAMLLSEASSLSNLEFPAPGAGNYIRWNVAGDELEAVSAVNDSGSFLQSGTGAVSRTVTSKIGEIVSVKDFGATGDGVTDDGAGIASAITVAIAGGNTLYWPDGDYLTTSSIANLHSVRHFGPGVIKRGSDSFVVCPAPGASTTNKIYLATTGAADTNDGLSSGEPLLTMQAGFDILPNYELYGTWNFTLAAGTWTEGGVMQDGLKSEKRIQIYGPDVSAGTPTAIFDGTGATNSHALHFKANNFIHVKDIKGQDWLNFTTLSATVGLQDFCDVWTQNVHASNNGAGINGSNGARLRVQGGTIDSCATGILCVNNITYTIGQGATMLSEGPVISNCTSAAVTVQEMSSGHVDWTTIGDGNNIGLNILQGGRVHLQGSDVKNNTEGARLNTGGWLFENTTNTNNWNEGTVDANTTKWKQQAFAGDTVILQSAQSEVRVATDLTTHTHTGSTARTVVATPWTIPDDFFVEQNRKLRILVFGEYTTNTGTVNIGVDFGGAVMEQLTAVGTPTGGRTFKAEFNIWATGGSSQDLSSVLLHGTAGVRTENRTRASVMTSGDKALQVTVQQSVSGDTTTIEQIEVWLTG